MKSRMSVLAVLAVVSGLAVAPQASAADAATQFTLGLWGGVPISISGGTTSVSGLGALSAMYSVTHEFKLGLQDNLVGGTVLGNELMVRGSYHFTEAFFGGVLAGIVTSPVSFIVGPEVGYDFALSPGWVLAIKAEVLWFNFSTVLVTQIDPMVGIKYSF